MNGFENVVCDVWVQILHLLLTRPSFLSWPVASLTAYIQATNRREREGISSSPDPSDVLRSSRLRGDFKSSRMSHIYEHDAMRKTLLPLRSPRHARVWCWCFSRIDYWNHFTVLKCKILPEMFRFFLLSARFECVRETSEKSAFFGRKTSWLIWGREEEWSN